MKSRHAATQGIACTGILLIHLPVHASTLDDLQLVEDALAALAKIPSPHQVARDADGVHHNLDWGCIGYQYAILEGLQCSCRLPLTSGHYEDLDGDGRPLTEAGKALFQAELEGRETANPWLPLPRHAPRLDELLSHHVEGAITKAPHFGFSGPVAGHSHLAGHVRAATSLEWLLHCDQRCMGCRTAALRDLQALRRILTLEAEQRRRSSPAVHWRETTNPAKKTRRVSVKNECYGPFELTGRLAEVFLAVAEQGGLCLKWKDFVRAEMGRLGEEFGRGAISEASLARHGREIAKKLNELGHYWSNADDGAIWNPPEGSGPLPT